MGSKKKLLLGFGGVLLLTAGVVFLIPTTRFILVGYARGEPFHKNRPLGFWIHELQSEGRGDGGWARAQAAIALGEIGTQAAPAIPALTDALRDNEQQVRREAAFALGRIGPDASEAVPAILEATSQEREWDELTLNKYAEILLTIGPKGVPPLAKALRHENPGTRWCAARALTLFGLKAKEAIPALIENLKDAKTQEHARFIGSPSDIKGKVFYQSAAALGEMGPDAREAVPVIVGALKNGIVPAYGRGARIPLDDEPLAALAKIDPDLASIVFAMPKLVPVNANQLTRNFETVIGGLRHEKKHVREFAAFVLGWCMPNIGGPTIGPANSKSARAELTRLLKDDDESVRWCAAIALIRLNVWNQKEPEAESRLALPVLIEVLSKDKNHARLRYLAADALTFIGTQGRLGDDFLVAAPVLALALNDSEDRVRRTAMFSLGRVSNRPEHVQAVVRCAIEVLSGKQRIPIDPFLGFLPEQDVIELLGRIGPDAAEAVPLLIQMERIDLDGPRPELWREKIREALKKIDPNAAAKAGIK